MVDGKPNYTTPDQYIPGEEDTPPPMGSAKFWMDMAKGGVQPGFGGGTQTAALESYKPAPLSARYASALDKARGLDLSSKPTQKWTGFGPSGKESSPTPYTPPAWAGGAVSPYEQKIRDILADPNLRITSRNVAKMFAADVLGITPDNVGTSTETAQQIMNRRFGPAGTVAGQARGIDDTSGFTPFYSGARSSEQGRAGQNLGLPQINIPGFLQESPQQRAIGISPQQQVDPMDDILAFIEANYPGMFSKANSRNLMKIIMDIFGGSGSILGNQGAT